MGTNDAGVTVALGAGVLGAGALTALHESARRLLPEVAPRMDVLGAGALVRLARHMGAEPSKGRGLRRAALAGDLLSNSLYYALAAVGGRRRALARGALLGGLAGLGAVLLPPLMRLPREASAAAPSTAVMTIAWYLAGGLVSGAVLQRVAP